MSTYASSLSGGNGGGGGSGTVTSVSVVSANGLAGTVANPTTTPAITLSTTINAPLLAGNGTAISAATTTGTGSTAVLSISPTLSGTLTVPNIQMSSVNLASTNNSLTISNTLGMSIAMSGVTGGISLISRYGTIILDASGNVNLNSTGSGTVVANTGIALPIRTTSGNVVLTAADYQIVLTDTTAANYTITFPAGANGRSFVICSSLASSNAALTTYTFVPNGADTFDNPLTAFAVPNGYPNPVIETFYNGVWYQTT